MAPFDPGNPFPYAYDHLLHSILRITMHHVDRQSNAEDITQDAFVKLLEHRRPFASEEHLKAWMIRVTLNLCKNHNRAANQRNAPLPDQVPVTVYSFKDLTKQSEFGDAANFGLNAVIDPDKSKVLAFGLSGMTFDEATGHVIISGWLMHGEDQGVVAVLGDPLKEVTLKGYTDGGCTEELAGFSGEIETGAAILQDVFRKQLAVFIKRSVNLTERFKQNSDERQQQHFAEAVYDSALALLQEHLQQNHLRYWDPVIHMDSLMGDALTMARVLYLEVDITVPARQFAELSIASIRPPHQNIYRSGRSQKDKNLFGFDWLTSTGGSLALRHLTADVILPENATIRYQNLGLDTEATGKIKITLDSDIAHHYLAITVPDYVK